MSSSLFATDPALGEETPQYEQYRSLSISAIISLILSILSLPALFLPALLFLPLGAAVSATLALRQIRATPDELAGRGLAWTGLILSLVALSMGGGMAIFTYATEVPEGYRRLTFAELRPGPDEAHLQIPQAIMQLDGQRIFVKGYVLSDDRRSDLKRFVLVPDMGTCCFGGTPKLTDMIEVILEDPLRVRYSWQKRKLAGTLHIDPRYKRENGADGAHYRLHADYVR